MEQSSRFLLQKSWEDKKHLDWLRAVSDVS